MVGGFSSSLCCYWSGRWSRRTRSLRGHGGPVRAIAVSPDGAHAISGSFDATAIRLVAACGTAQDVLRFHESAVNAVAFLKDGRMATGGEDGDIAIWQPNATSRCKFLKGTRRPS